MEEKLLQQILASEIQRLAETIQAMETATLTFVDLLSQQEDADKRMLAIARTQFQLGFLAVERGVKPLFEKSGPV